MNLRNTTLTSFYVYAILVVHREETHMATNKLQKLLDQLEGKSPFGNKNGFEIRADILKLAQDHLQTEFGYAHSQYEQSITVPEWKSIKVTKPTYPSTQRVLETAKEMYTFVNTQV